MRITIPFCGMRLVSMGPAIAKLLKMSVQTMTDDRFWALIDQARDKGGASADPRKLKSILD